MDWRKCASHKLRIGKLTDLILINLAFGPNRLPFMTQYHQYGRVLLRIASYRCYDNARMFRT